VDFGEGAAAAGPHRTVALPSASLSCLPEASGIPSPDTMPCFQKSEWNVLESREWRSITDEDRPITAPQFTAGAMHAQHESAEMVADDPAAPPLTSTFDVHAALASVRLLCPCSHTAPHACRPSLCLYFVNAVAFTKERVRYIHTRQLVRLDGGGVHL
jgi:hypothetical protein